MGYLGSQEDLRLRSPEKGSRPSDSEQSQNGDLLDVSELTFKRDASISIWIYAYTVGDTPVRCVKFFKY